MNILEALDDHRLLGHAIKDPVTFAYWRSFLAAFFALEMTDAELAMYTECTGRLTAPTEPFSEAFLPCGRRAGKSFVLALIAVYLACFREYREYLAPGERATVMILAADRRQARTIFRYLRGILTGSPILAPLLERETADALDLTNGITIEIGTASVKTTRGYSLCAVLCDEIAFWETNEDSASPDYEILNAVRPGMATIPGSVLLAASSPYAKRGILYEAFNKFYGVDSAPVLVWRAPTLLMNPTVPKRIVDEAYARDPAAAAAEFGAEWRQDLEAFCTQEVVRGCVPEGVHERPAGGLKYSAFTDPSGGSADSFTIAIGHKEGNRAVLDVIREARPPFSPDEVVREFAALLKSYNIRDICGDAYAGEWPRERFRVRGINYKVSRSPKSDIYRDLLPLLNSGRVQLLDHPRLISQLTSLERRTARSGKDSIDHPRGGHDDVSNAVAGVLTTVIGPATGTIVIQSIEDAFSGVPPGFVPGYGCYVNPKTGATWIPKRQ